MLSEKLLEAAGNSTQPTYIEDVFSTYLYTGNGSTQTITNGIDLSGKGGLVWIKRRNGIRSHALLDTARGASVGLSSNTTDANTTYSPAVMTAFNSNGFSLDSNIIGNNLNDTYVSWTFREQPKFFDVVTYTGNGVAGRTISHSLGSTPGCIIVKQTSASGQDWMVYHRSLGTNGFILLNSTGAASTYPYLYGPTSTTFTVDSSSPVNANGQTYVAYLFAHNAGGFGASGTDNVISCGSFTTPGGQGDFSGYTVTLGYEPQFVLMKRTDNTGDWFIFDNMRGTPVDRSGAPQASPVLFPNLSSAESQYSPSCVAPTPTGFAINNSFFTFNASTYIYIAIRRGPMKTPTTGTSVFSPSTYSGNNTTKSITGIGFATDLVINKPRANTLGSGNTGVFWDRLRGFPDGSTNPALVASSTTDEASWASLFNMFGYINNTNPNPQDGYKVINGSSDGRLVNYSSEAIGYISWLFKRAPGFFDVVCYTGNGSTQNVNHNLGVAPELMIVKRRNSTGAWGVYSATTGNSALLQLESTGAVQTGAPQWNSTTPTSSVFSLGVSSTANASGGTYVAYLFASCPGVSKVTSFTGNGSSQTINCGFTAGARFVLIKRTDSTGDWYIWDSARGIVSGNDPHLSLNSTAAEVTTDDTIDTDSTGFIVNQVSATNCNVNGASYIVLAVA